MTALAARGATWGSVLPVDEFAAVRSVGFEPAGQVFGAAVYPLVAPGKVTAELTNLINMGQPKKCAPVPARRAGRSGPPWA